eukprot:3933012-Rhodomonas_salina.6
MLVFVATLLIVDAHICSGKFATEICGGNGGMRTHSADEFRAAAFIPCTRIDIGSRKWYGVLVAYWCICFGLAGALGPLALLLSCSHSFSPLSSDACASVALAFSRWLSVSLFPHTQLHHHHTTTTHQTTSRQLSERALAGWEEMAHEGGSEEIASAVEWYLSYCTCFA